MTYTTIIMTTKLFLIRFKKHKLIKVISLCSGSSSSSTSSSSSSSWGLHFLWCWTIRVWKFSFHSGYSLRYFLRWCLVGYNHWRPYMWSRNISAIESHKCILWNYKPKVKRIWTFLYKLYFLQTFHSLFVPLFGGFRLHCTWVKWSGNFYCLPVQAFSMHW